MEAAYRRTLPLLGAFVGLFAAGLGVAVYMSTLPSRSWMTQASARFPRSADPAFELGMSWVQDGIPVVTDPPGASVYAGPNDNPTVLCVRTPCTIPTSKVTKLEEAVLVLPGYETANIALWDVLHVPGGGEIRHAFERRPLAEWRAATQSNSISIRQGETKVTGPMPAEVVTRIVRQNFGRFKLCYEKALTKDATASGRIVIGFTMTANGDTQDVVVKNTTIKVAGFADCMREGFTKPSFPMSERPTKVEYELSFAPPSS